MTEQPSTYECRNCLEPLVDLADEHDPGPEWAHARTLNWPCPDGSGRGAGPRRTGKCEFCQMPGTALVAALVSDSDQRVCQNCHDDPRVPTQEVQQ